MLTGSRISAISFSESSFFSRAISMIDRPVATDYACHEGNYGVANTLKAVRMEEKKAAEAAAPKGTK